LKDAYFVFVDARKNRDDLPFLPAALSGDLQLQEALLMQYCGRPFMLQLRRLLIDRLLEDNSKNLGVLSKFSQRTQALVLGRFVDLLFRNLPGLAKIEDSVQPFHRYMHDARRGQQLPTPAHPVPEPEDISLQQQVASSLGRWRDAFVRTRRPESGDLARSTLLSLGSLGKEHFANSDSADSDLPSCSTPKSSAAFFEQYDSDLQEFQRDASPLNCDTSPKFGQELSPTNVDQSPLKNSLP